MIIKNQTAFLDAQKTIYVRTYIRIYVRGDFETMKCAQKGYSM